MREVTVLVVDDEPDIRATVSAMLEMVLSFGVLCGPTVPLASVTGAATCST